MATKKTKKKASATRGPKAAKRARRAAKSGPRAAAVGAELDPDYVSFLNREAAIRAVAREDRPLGRYSLEDTVDIALQAWERMTVHQEALEHIDAGVPGTLEALAALPEYARALRYANTQYALAQGSEGNARVPAHIVAEAKALTDRMSHVLRYYFGREQKISDRLDFLASGLGYRHTAIELGAYAQIYEERAKKLEKDEVLYNPQDAVRARELAVQINDLVGRPKGGNLAEWADLRSSIHALLERTYDRLIRLLAGIEHERPRAEYPSLAAAVRALRAPRPARRNGDEDEVPEDDAPTPPAVRPPEDEETPA